MTTYTEVIKDDARYESEAHKAMLTAQIIIKDVRGGTLVLRSKGDTYLLKFPIESKGSYDTRLKTATLFNFYAKTEEAMLGLVFRKNPTLGKDVSEQIVKLWENIDACGTHGDVFSKEVFKKQFDGHVFIVTEYPKADPNIKTRADERASGRRPYLVVYEACQALNWDSKLIGGNKTLTQITFKEESIERTGQFKEEKVCRYRTWRLELAPVSENSQEKALRATWELQKEVKNEKGEMVLEFEDKGTTSLTRIPVAVAYGGKTSFLTSQPPLIDLALKNIEHYQDYSDYRRGKSVAGIAFPWARNLKNDPDNDKIALGWDIFVEVEDNGEVGFAEASGNALNAQRQALEDIKAEMASLGLAMLIKKDVAITATQSITDNAKEQSQLETIARSLSDALELSFEYMAEYLGIQGGGGSISLSVDDGRLSLDPQMANFYLQAVDSGRLSPETFLMILERGELLPEGQTAQMELERLRTTAVIPTVSQ